MMEWPRNGVNNNRRSPSDYPQFPPILKQPKDITDLQEAILAIHGYKALYSRTVYVREVLDEGVAWDGLVRVFALPECPKAKHCFAWRFTSGGETRVVAILEIPPIDSPQAAVRARNLRRRSNVCGHISS